MVKRRQFSSHGLDTRNVSTASASSAMNTAAKQKFFKSTWSKKKEPEKTELSLILNDSPGTTKTSSFICGMGQQEPLSHHHVRKYVARAWREEPNSPGYDCMQWITDERGYAKGHGRMNGRTLQPLLLCRRTACATTSASSCFPLVVCSVVCLTSHVQFRLTVIV